MFVMLQNKEFIYRGGGYEKLSSFSQRIMSEFPGATLLDKGSPPSEHTKCGEGQCILYL